MTSDYQEISAYNEKQLGEDRASRKSQVAMYTEPVHFIYELLQNADDAGATKISFVLTENQLIIEHNGKPFTESNVKAISYFEKSDKTESGEEITKIGHFGLGFKSVFAYTASPQIHSGQESFKITQLYTVEGIPYPTNFRTDQTRFILPFDHLIQKPVYIESRKLKSPENACQDIAGKLKKLGADTLLFTKFLEEICWASLDSNGHYQRNSSSINSLVREISIHADNLEQRCYLVFDRPIYWLDDKCVEKQHRPVQIAYELDKPRKDGGVIRKINNARLFVFFPTTKETHIGLILQGPYRTNPPRENIFSDDEFNQHLVNQTAELLAESLYQLKELGLLNLNSLSILPLDQAKFEDDIFEPLYLQVCKTLRTSQLLPKHQGGFSSANESCLARGAKLADIFEEEQLSKLFGKEKLEWLDTSLTKDNYPDLYTFLKNLGDEIEVSADDLVPKLTPEFLSNQSIAWLIKFIQYVEEGAKVLRRVPFIRLQSGEQVALPESSIPTARFMPDETEGLDLSAFPLVHAELAANETVRAFLVKEGIRKIDAVDIVVESILPKYENTSEFNLSEYLNDLHQIAKAYTGDDEIKKKLEVQLKNIAWLACVKAGADAEDEIVWNRPNLYGGDLFARPEELEFSYSELEGSKIYFLHPLFEKQFDASSSFKKYLDEKCVRPLDVADIVEKVILPKYKGADTPFDESKYREDLQWILKARYVPNLKHTQWLACVHASGNKPDEIVWKQPNSYSDLYEKTPDHEAWLYKLENSNAYFLHSSITDILNNNRDRFIPNFAKLTQNSEQKTITEQCEYLSNPLYNKWIKTYDFNPYAEIVGLKEAIKHRSINKSRVLWKILLKEPKLLSGEIKCSSHKTKVEAAEKHLYFTEIGKLCREHKWIFGKDGSWHRPSELLLTDLPDEFDTSSVYAKEVAEKLGMKKPETEEAINILAGNDPNVINQIKRFISVSPADREKMLKIIPEETPPQPAPSFKEALGNMHRLQRGSISANNTDNPSYPLHNPERYQNKVNQEAEEKVKQHETTPQTLRFSIVRESSSSQQARDFLYEQYEGRCQITGNTFPKASANANGDAKYYFEACSLLSYINADYLNDAGNILCVSADTMAKLKNASFEWLDDLEAIIKGFKNRQPAEIENVKAKIQLACEECEITWSERHFARLVALWDKA